MTLATYKPSASFSAKPYLGGRFNPEIPRSAKLGPVPDTEEESREWLLAALELKIQSHTYCDDDSEENGCDCEQCYYARTYANDTPEGYAKSLVGEIESLNSGTSLRDLMNEIAGVRHQYWNVAFGFGHGYSDAGLVSAVITEYAPLESSAIPGCSINMPVMFDGMA